MKKLIATISLVIVIGIIVLFVLMPTKNIEGIENYDKNYYIKEYGGDLDSNLSIFPDDKSKLINADFISSFHHYLFDSDGYIILKVKYNKVNYDSEINRIKSLNMTIRNGCLDNAESFENTVKYDESSYSYPSYITIDGFGHTYEYALLNDSELEIIYVYLSYPSEDNSDYKEYLKIDKSEYSKINITGYSMYNHSFNNGKSYIEFDDCIK